MRGFTLHDLPTPPRAAFDRGQDPVVSLVNIAMVPLGIDLAKLAGVLQEYVNHHLGPVWDLPLVKIQATAGRTIPAGTWGLRFADDADQPGVLGYHDLTPQNLPISNVFVRTIVGGQESIPVTASHELAEMLIDPAINLWAEKSDGVLWAYESSDAVEDTAFAVDGVPCSNFQYPSWFEKTRKPKSTRFDHLAKCTKPFQLLRGGYSLVLQSGRISQVFGSLAKEKRFAREERKGHRSEDRKVRAA